MSFTHKFVTVVNSDGSIITCPIESLTDETWLFTKKKKVVSSLEVINASNYKAKEIAEAHHKMLVWSIDGEFETLFEDVVVDGEC